MQQNEQPRGSKVGRSLSKKQDRRTSKVEVVDLRILLTQCAQAVANNNSRAVDELLKRIRKHPSSYGDDTEKLAHYFANALQARLTGTGTTLYTAFTTSRISAADIKIVSGQQEELRRTGRRLANYCKRFNVPFEYNAIARKWDTIQREDLMIDSDEMLIVNCLYWFRNVPDETVGLNCAREIVLKLIKRTNPDMFIHGVVNGTYNPPFFLTRFKEAHLHFQMLFDMLEATVPCGDSDRLLFEKEVFGRDAVNVIACEGTWRIERPESCKQWQVRNQRAGFGQLPLNRDIIKEVSAKGKAHYHKDFVVDEDGNWMQQGWKGRILTAVSCWKPTPV